MLQVLVVLVRTVLFMHLLDSFGEHAASVQRQLVVRLVTLSSCRWLWAGHFDRHTQQASSDGQSVRRKARLENTSG